MLRRLIPLLAITLFAASVQAAPTIGLDAPAFSGVDALSGATVNIANFKGKVVVLEWNNFECPFVKKHYATGTMQALQANAAKDGVVWITINSSAEGKEGYLKDAQVAKDTVLAHMGQSKYYVLDHDGTIGHAYGAKATPTMVVIDKAGKLAYIGAIDNKPTADTADIASATNYVTEALEALKMGRPVKTPVTQAYGCFVKY